MYWDGRRKHYLEFNRGDKTSVRENLRFGEKGSKTVTEFIGLGHKLVKFSGFCKGDKKLVKI